MTNQRLSQFLSQLKNSHDLFSNIPSWTEVPEKEASYSDFPNWVSPELKTILESQGIHALYSHQLDAIERIHDHENIVISTGTASGKSLCYQIPILNGVISGGQTKALLVFPTKALAYDQLNSLNEYKKAYKELFPSHSDSITPAVYDGDTATYLRSSIRNNSNILLTNPDMVHLGILPHHTAWVNFLEHLEYIVFDEIHIYRGVFGSHIANVLRRLQRILEFYRVTPQFIFTSATIANPQEHAEKMVGRHVELIDSDGSPHGKKSFIFYDPPIVNQELGIRQGLISATEDLTRPILNKNLQTLLFTKSRRSVEMLIHELRKLFPGENAAIRGYRSGYLKTERREIEQGLKNGQVKLAVATNALELGVDIGGVDLVIMAGYPGSITSTRQRAGRAGRKNEDSAAFMIASMNPLDQFLCQHPEYILQRDPEIALIDPDNPLILIQQLQCAVFELAFLQNDSFGTLKWEELSQYLEILQNQGVVVNKSEKYFWLSENYPSSSVSLRSTATKTITIQLEKGQERFNIGEIDYASSLWMTHPGAVYLHEGEPYLVKSLDLENDIAVLSSENLSYFTEPIKNQEIQIIREIVAQATSACEIHFGEIEVATRIESFKKIDWETRAILSIEEVDLPATILRTFGFWIILKPETIEKMRNEKMWFSDPNDYGPKWEKQRNLARQRDQFRCRVCGAPENGKPHHVHHKIPFRLFSSSDLANNLDNLVTLCSSCHRLAEMNVRIRSAISGLKYSLFHLAPLIVMCDENDLGAYADPAADFCAREAVVLLYDTIPAGMGLSDTLYKKYKLLLQNALDLIDHCGCLDGCPSCVGPNTESGIGGKKETRFLINLLLNGN